MREYLERVRETSPLIHNITNYVTVNDCANILLACGGSPIMADDPEEAEEITSICGGLNINIGTLNQHTISAMVLAGRKANLCGHPVLLDPVGAGASSLRTETARKLLEELDFAVIRGNISEIKALAGEGSAARGVDADAVDAVTEENMEQAAELVRAFAADIHTVTAVSGAIDLVSDGEKTYIIRNGCPIMSRITGSGCMLSAMTAAYITANPNHVLEAAAASFCAMGLAGEIAEKRMKPEDGNSSFRNYLIDAVYHLQGATLEKGARYEVR